VDHYRPLSSVHPIWYLACLEITQANKIPYVNTLWKGHGEIRIESLTLGNTSQWIEQAYGEDAVYLVVGADLTEFGSPDFRNEFLKPFPKIKKTLSRYEQVLRRVSRQRGARLEIRYEGRKGLASFYLDGIVDVNSNDPKLELKNIATAIDAMKEAYQEIADIRKLS